MPPQAMLGPYIVGRAIASGGMATVHVGRLTARGGFSRTVAIKRMHVRREEDPELEKMFLEEGRLAARIRHPNVVSTLDVVEAENEIVLVMEYVHGAALSFLAKKARETNEAIPLSIACAIMSSVLHGLHAAHEARDEHDRPLGIVHRDVSPQNVIVGVDGMTRLVDFGVAKALRRLYTTQDGRIKGKLPYTAPEIVRGRTPTRQTDIFSASVMLWEMLTGRSLFDGANEGAVVEQILLGVFVPPSRFAPKVPRELDVLVRRGLAGDPAKRFETAREMATALERIVVPATQANVAAWVEASAADLLRQREEVIAEVERMGIAATTGSAQAPAARVRRPTTWIPVGITGLAVAATTLMSVRAASRQTREEPSVPATASLGSSISLAPPDPVGGDIDEPVAPTTPLPSAHTATPRAKRLVTGSGGASASGKGSKECERPYVLDATGRKIWKRGCI